MHAQMLAAIRDACYAMRRICRCAPASAAASMRTLLPRQLYADVRLRDMSMRGADAVCADAARFSCFMPRQQRRICPLRHFLRLFAALCLLRLRACHEYLPPLMIQPEYAILYYDPRAAMPPYDTPPLPRRARAYDAAYVILCHVESAHAEQHTRITVAARVARYAAMRDDVASASCAAALRCRP